MISQLKTKLAGTAVFGVIVLSVTGLTYSAAQAKLVSQNTTLNVNGVVSVVDIAGGTITITTVDSSPITFAVNNGTKFGPSGTNSLLDVSVGDSILINGDRNGTHYTADKITEQGGPNYGANHNRVFVADGVVTDKNGSDSNFTVRFGNTWVNFEVHITTKFSGTTWNKLKVGQKVKVNGEDTGTYYLADKVTAE